MTKSNAVAGYFRSGLPYYRFGYGPRTLVIFQGLHFENKPLSGRMARLYSSVYKFLGKDFTTYVVTRRPGLPSGYTMQDMSDDYATMIKEEFGKPVDVIGMSTGGSIAQHFAADHPDLIRRLIIHSSAYVLSDEAKRLQMHVALLARQRQWRKAYATMFAHILPRSRVVACIARPIVWLGSLSAGLLGAPEDPSDFAVTVEAEDKHDFKDRLAQITAPTLLVAGNKDPFYPESLFRETAEGIPNARLIIYEGMGHPASGTQFDRDVLTFLKEGVPEDIETTPGLER